MHATLVQSGECYSAPRVAESLDGGIDLHGDSRHCQAMKTYMCLICGFVFDEQAGDPENGIPPATRWDDVPLSWRCPDCGAGKEDFQMVEI